MVRLGFQVLIVLAVLAAGAVGSALFYGEVLQPAKVFQPPVFIAMDDVEAHVGCLAGGAAGVSPGESPIGLRCNEQVSQCIEAAASLLHGEGQALAVEAMYRIVFTEHEAIEPEQITAETDCVHGMLQLNASSPGAHPFWQGTGECEADPGCRSLAGDLL